MVIIKWKHWNQIQIFENKMIYCILAWVQLADVILNLKASKYIFVVVSICTICNFEYILMCMCTFGINTTGYLIYCAVILLLIIWYLYPISIYWMYLYFWKMAFQKLQLLRFSVISCHFWFILQIHIMSEIFDHDVLQILFFQIHSKSATKKSN